MIRKAVWASYKLTASWISVIPSSKLCWWDSGKNSVILMTFISIRVIHYTPKLKSFYTNRSIGRYNRRRGEKRTFPP
jgi:hypothetical protein